MTKKLTRAAKIIIEHVAANPGKIASQICEDTNFASSRVYYLLAEHCQRWRLPMDGTKRRSHYVWTSKTARLYVAGAVREASTSKPHAKTPRPKMKVGPIRPDGPLPWWWGVETAELNEVAAT